MTEKCFYGGISALGLLYGAITRENLQLTDFLSSLTTAELLAFIARIVVELNNRTQAQNDSV